MTTNPTPDQIEAARDAMMRTGSGRFGVSVVGHGMSILDAYGELAQVALAAAGVTLQEPARVEDALRFCTCSHWLEAHQDRECMELGCACKNFGPVVQESEAALYEAVDTAQRVWNGNDRHESMDAAITRSVLGEIGGGR